MTSTKMRIGATVALTALLLLGGDVAVHAAVAAIAVDVPAVVETPVRFGMDVGSIGGQKALGVAPDYAMFWAGSWNEKSGFGGIASSAKSAADQGVVPVVQWWYWGDDISQSCVNNGCTDRYQGVWKDQAHWATDGAKVADNLHQGLQGRPGVVVLETEFNKGSIQGWSAFNAMLQQQAGIFRQRAPEVQLVLGLGNWALNDWPTWKPAAGAVDMVGFQTMRGSTRESDAAYTSTVDALSSSTKLARDTFGKPVLLDDFALCSAPEPAYADMQQQVIAGLFSRIGELKANGLSGIVYRSLVDNSGANTANYYGACEKSFGFQHADGSAKPALSAWVAGIQAERAPKLALPVVNPPVAALGTNVSGLTVHFDGSRSSGVDLGQLTYAWTFGDGKTATGAVVDHNYTTAGTYAVTLTVREGVLADVGTANVTVQAPNRAPLPAFTASTARLTVHLDASGTTDPDGDALSYTWKLGDGRTAAGRVVDATYAAAGNYTVTLAVRDGLATATTSHAVSLAPFAATFAVQPDVNAYWVNVKVGANAALARVDVQVDGGAWTTLDPTSYGTWAKGMSVPGGSRVVFRATASDGATATSANVTWPGPAPLAATFLPRTITNNWWLEVKVTASAPLGRVEARVNSGAWSLLPATSWGTYAKSLNAPDGAQVQFRAISTTGAVAMSPTYRWG